MPGLHNITYTYTPQGCNPIPVGGSILINEAPTVLPNDVTTNNPSCFGYNDGSAILTASSGQPAYIFNWFGEDPFALTAGTFNYTVTDANQCTFNSSVTLYDPLNTTSIINEYNSSCYGENDGAASITMLGGVTPPGTVSLLPYCASNPSPDFDAQAATYIQHVELSGDNSSQIDNNTAGINDFYEDYTATIYAGITEGNLYTINVTIGDLFGGSYNGGAKVFIDYNIDGDFLDAGEDIGIIPVQATAGTSVPLNFTVPTTGAFGATRMRVVCWSEFDFATPNDITPCESPAAGTFSQPWFGATEDYSIVLNAPGFSATYLWDNGVATDSIANLGPGIYYVIITDTETGCPIQDSAVITEPEQITFNPTITDISCNAFTDGSVTLNPSGGNGGAYNINWGGIDSSALANGSYTVTVTDPSTITTENTIACFNDTLITLVEPGYFSVDFTVSDHSICAGDPIDLEFDFNSNGVAPFTINYNANGPQAAGPVNNSGQYSFSVSPNITTTYSINSIVDAEGCINQNTTNNEIVNVNPLPNMNIAVNPNPICVGDNSTLIMNNNIGTPPFSVDYSITDANGTTTANEVFGSGGFNTLINPIITTDYTLTSITDDSTCTSSLSAVTTLVVNEIPQLVTSYSNELCDGDLVEIGLDFTAGTPPFNVDYTFNGANTNTVINFQTGDLTLIATDPSNITINSITGANCFKQIDEDIVITINSLPIATLIGDGSICEGGTTDLSIVTTNGAPLYDIEYTNGTENFTLTDIGDSTGISTATMGLYTLVSVIDQNGCEATTLNGQANVNINPLPDVALVAYPLQTEITDPLINFIDKSTYLSLIPGTWDFGDGSEQASNLGHIDHMYADTGVYLVSLETVSDSGCTNIAYQTIIISPTFTMYVPNAFTPNNDLDNDYFLPIVDGVQEYELSIYDRLGKRVFRTDKYTNEYCTTGCDEAWDGKINGSSDFCTIGVYVYHIIVTDVNGKLRNYEGTVTLVR
ncbi:gliding motility-associated C-terminal domain-containing protein [Flavobacteriales bacterium]|nr:gliding motility-associated C-terminal domain-containing protein [Flavobacteriales bacterium]